MMFTLALRSLFSKPIRSAVLAGGFGLGVAVMAALLGIGGVILEQARAPELVGGGDVVIAGAGGRISNPRFLLANVLASGPLASRVKAAAPSSRAVLYLVTDSGTVPVRTRGGIPSLERALDDLETRGIDAWRDTPDDRRWASPDPAEVLREMDRFHPIPDVPARAASWAEWLYFNGRSGDTRFYLTFLAGRRTAAARRVVGVRLQLDRRGALTSYSTSTEIGESELLSTAPDVTVGRNRVRLVDREYRISLDLPAEAGHHGVRGELVVQAAPGNSMPPVTMQGAGGWVSGYVVPVMSGALGGWLEIGGDRIALAGGSGYHDHNWGFWDGVSWQWGQVQGGGLSFVYGRVRPPADAADPARIPGFLVALGADGPVGYATDVTIDETNRTGSNRPERIVVRGRSASLDLTLDLAVEQATATSMREGSFGAGLDFLQLRTRYRVSGRAGDVTVDFSAPGSAETFRGRPAAKP